MTPQITKEQNVRIDASKLSFPLQVLILVITTVASVVGSTWQMRSDLRDEQTRSEYRQEIYSRDQKTNEEAIRALRAQVELLRIEFNEMNLALAKSGVYVKERK